MEQRKSINATVVDVHHSFWIFSTLAHSPYVWEIFSPEGSEPSNVEATKLFSQPALLLRHSHGPRFNQIHPRDTLNWKEEEAPCGHSSKGGGRCIQLARGSVADVESSALSSSGKVSMEGVLQCDLDVVTVLTLRLFLLPSLTRDSVI